MARSRILIAAASALTVISGGSYLAQPAAAAELFACTSYQRAIIHDMATGACGGTAIVTYSCSGTDMTIHDIDCSLAQ